MSTLALYVIDTHSALLWYRHLGHQDGSFQWEGPKEVGAGWSNFKQVFSGGDDIIYAIEPPVEATIDPVSGGRFPASGGKLLWYRHLGHQDGSFQWEGPKEVGAGWSNFKQVFSGGDDIIYAIEPPVEVTIDPVSGRRTPASGGKLLWYRHLVTCSPSCPHS